MDKPKYCKKHEIRCEIIKNKQVMKKIGGEKRGKNSFGQLILLFLPKCIETQNKNAQISQKSQNTAVNQPIKNYVMRPIKPRLLRPKLGLVIFIEHQIKIFRPPAQNWMFLKSFQSHAPNSEQRFNCLFFQRDIGKTFEHIIFVDEIRIL